MLKPVLGSQLEFGHPLARGLVGCWLMNEGGGNKVSDLSGNGNTGSLVADTHFVPGKFSSALDFDGTGDYVNFGTGSSLNLPGDMSLFLWVKFDDVVTRGIVCGQDDGTTWCQYHIEVGTTDNELRVYWGDTTIDDSSVSLQIGRWYFIGFTRTGSTGSWTSKIYIDGVLDETATGIATNPGSQDGPFSLGRSVTYPALEFNGQIDHLMIFNHALSASEIAWLYREPFCIFEQEPIDLWTGATSVGAPPVGAAGIMTPNTGYWGPTY